MNLPRPAPLGTVPVMVIVGAAVVATAGAAVRVTAHLANVALEPTGQWSGRRRRSRCRTLPVTVELRPETESVRWSLGPLTEE